MKRLLQISFDTLLISVLPIIIWIFLGIFLEKDLANVFSLTYPFQFLYVFFIFIFAIGPNITEAKHNYKDVVNTNLFLGIVVGGIITILLVFNVDPYIRLMSMEPSIYRIFCIYSIIWMYFNFIMQSILNKLYYHSKNKQANRISTLFNLTNFISIIILTIVTHNSILIVTITLFLDFIILAIVLSENFQRFHFHCQFFKNIRYTSFNLFESMGMVLIYGIGTSVSFSYGSVYQNAINVEGLATDTGWDVENSIETVAKIDIADGKFNYKKHLKEAYKLLMITIPSIIIIMILLSLYFQPNLIVLLVIIAVQIIDMILHPITIMKMSYLQIEKSSKKNNIHRGIVSVIRVLCSFLPTAYCTYIGQIFMMLYLYVYSYIECRKVPIFNMSKM